MNSPINKTILIAEDHEDSRIVLCLFLKSLNYQVIEAKNGKEAVRLAEEKHPDLIVMDLNMPIIDGIEAATQIRRNVELENIPIIVNSGNGKCGIDFFTNIADLGRGFISYLTKPVNFNELKEQIDIALAIPYPTH